MEKHQKIASCLNLNKLEQIGKKIQILNTEFDQLIKTQDEHEVTEEELNKVI